MGGAAHLWDCIPSKTMVATSLRMQAIRNARDLGITGKRFVGRSDPSGGAYRVDLVEPRPEVDRTSCEPRASTSFAVEGGSLGRTLRLPPSGTELSSWNLTRRWYLPVQRLASLTG